MNTMYRIYSITKAYTRQISQYNQIIEVPEVKIDHGVFFDKFRADYIFKLLTENEDEMMKIAKNNNLNYQRRNYGIKEVNVEISGPMIKI